MAMRNLVKTRTYRERSQPGARKHLGLLEKHKLIVATMLTLRIMGRSGELPADQVAYLIEGRRVPNPPGMTAKVQEYLTELQWASACALKELEAFKPLTDDLELNVEAWREWVDSEKPEEDELPAVFAKVGPFQKLLLLLCSEALGVTIVLLT